jgi:hypothetical protein
MPCGKTSRRLGIGLGREQEVDRLAAAVASASNSSVAGLMTSSLLTPGTSLPLISNLNSLIALS